MHDKNDIYRASTGVGRVNEQDSKSRTSIASYPRGGFGQRPGVFCLLDFLGAFSASRVFLGGFLGYLAFKKGGPMRAPL